MEWQIQLRQERVGPDSPWESASAPHCGSSIQKVASLWVARFMAPHEMTWNNDTVAGVVNDPVNPNNGGEPLSLFLELLSHHHHLFKPL